MKKYLQFILFCLALIVVGFLCGSISLNTPILGYSVAFVFFVIFAYSTANVMKTYNELSRPENYSNNNDLYDIDKQIENGELVDETDNLINEEYSIEQNNE